jgi:hypothetical protein
MKNEHLLPVNIIDLVEKLNDKNIRENERFNYQLRIEAISAYCAEALVKYHSKKTVVKPNTRVYR